MTNELLTKGEYKVLMLLNSKKNKSNTINISITPLLNITEPLGYVQSTVYLHIKNLVKKGYIEWNKGFYIKVLKEYEE